MFRSLHKIIAAGALALAMLGGATMVMAPAQAAPTHTVLAQAAPDCSGLIC
ncbi:hypothetical protein [Goodfellowiella coeruleoviolacea]|uniref:Uncharacterized protein n=1 Tax=Goodfellowiella coeruleoviolacea TaxID=334858 RepID=A0AAE3GCB8_9PSEU|nr:hypothetical protein [Goodfellowiella coeruleoviolacea]MCP2164652.1 hypothetical protein [Goodfellowiella coeruleoviolacea]